MFPSSLTSKAFLQYGDVYYRWFFWKPTVMIVDHEGIHRVLTDSDAYRKNTPTYQAFSENAEIADQSEAIKATFSEEHMETLGNAIIGMAEGFCNQLVDAQGNGVAFNVFDTSRSVCTSSPPPPPFPCSPSPVATPFPALHSFPLLSPPTLFPFHC